MLEIVELFRPVRSFFSRLSFIYFSFKRFLLHETFLTDRNSLNHTVLQFFWKAFLCSFSRCFEFKCLYLISAFRQSCDACFAGSCVKYDAYKVAYSFVRLLSINVDKLNVINTVRIFMNTISEQFVVLNVWKKIRKIRRKT